MMKLLLSVSLTLVVLILAVLGLSYQLPKASITEKTIIVPASPDQVFAYLENPTEWTHWNAWNKAYDPSMIQLYGGPMRGKGARLSWNGDKVGKRDMVFTNSVSPETLQYEITRHNEQHKTQGTFELIKIDTGTLLKWREHTQLNDNPIGLISGAWRQYTTDKEMEQGLTGLKTLVEQNGKRRTIR